MIWDDGSDNATLTCVFINIHQTIEETNCYIFYMQHDFMVGNCNTFCYRVT